MIGDANIELLLDQLGIEARQRGGKWVAPCPFPDHDDRKPSWYIRDVPGEELHGLYYCSCARGGNVFTLVRDLVGIESSEVEQWLRDRGIVGDAVAATAFATVFRAAELELPFVMPPEFERRPLVRWPSAFRNYVAGRSITEAQVERWGIGYAVAGDLEGRVVIPIRGLHGELRSYVARAAGRSAVRYLTPGLEDHPRAGAVFGAERWGAFKRVVVLTEGAFNALACERAGAPAVAALGGSSVEAEHLSLLSRFERIVVATDPDTAGKRAAAAVGPLERHREVRYLTFPKGKDANDLPETELRAMLSKVC